MLQLSDVKLINFNSFKILFTILIVSSYKCTNIDDIRGKSLFYWNISVSDNCCQDCDGVVYKANSVIDTIQHENKCKTTETLVCKILPGISPIPL